MSDLPLCVIYHWQYAAQADSKWFPTYFWFLQLPENETIYENTHKSILFSTVDNWPKFLLPPKPFQKLFPARYVFS